MKDIAAGFGFSFFISTENKLYSCGKHQLSVQPKDFKDMKNLPTPSPLLVSFFSKKDISVKQVACGLVYACAVTTEGEVYSWGDNTFKQLGYEVVTKKKSDVPFVGEPTKIPYFEENQIKVKQISCSKGEKHNHTGCVTEDGRVFMWGDPYKGQLGLYLDDKGWTHEETSLYPTPLEMNLAFLNKKEPEQNDLGEEQKFE